MNATSGILLEFYEQLLAYFGKQYWWPGDSPYEIAIGAVLTQNTNWNNVEKAINNLKKRNLIDAQKMTNIDSNELAELIKPSGYFNLKANRLKMMTKWWQKNADRALKQHVNLDLMRNSLLSVKGIGEETADSILLYAFEYPTFVVDAYTKRFLIRHHLINEKASYHDMKLLFETHLACDVYFYREFHALIVALGKTSCKKTSPRCDHCCLNWHLR